MTTDAGPTYLALKYLLTAALVVLVSELARRWTLLGALLGALPLVSVLAMLWLYWEQGDPAPIADYSRQVFWLVLASLPLFALLPRLLAGGMRFYPALALAGAVGTLTYLGTAALLAARRAGG
ncbi:MAG: DUF3147 family protein [Pseudomonadota bacterium]|nr:DUF3147 family protein [Pseudomonadota bacterium]HJO34930.1 DUF3147 family protein [Gammaproteobacteria bacterium]